MEALEALYMTQDGLGEAGIQIRIVAPWSKESWSWRERRQDWTPSGDPVLPLPPQQNHPSSLTWFGQEAEQVTMSRDRFVHHQSQSPPMSSAGQKGGG